MFGASHAENGNDKIPLPSPMCERTPGIVGLTTFPSCDSTRTASTEPQHRQRPPPALQVAAKSAPRSPQTDRSQGPLALKHVASGHNPIRPPSPGLHLHAPFRSLSILDKRTSNPSWHDNTAAFGGRAAPAYGRLHPIQSQRPVTND